MLQGEEGSSRLRRSLAMWRRGSEDQEDVKGETLRGLLQTPYLGSNGVGAAGMLS